MHKRDFFISYSTADEIWATWIASTLREYGYSVFLQSWDIPVGVDFAHTMEKALKSSEGFIAVYSQSYSKSQYCLDELNAAYHLHHAEDMRILIIRVENFPIQPLYTPLVRLDIFNTNEIQATKRLLSAVSYKGEVHLKVQFPNQTDASEAYGLRYFDEVFTQTQRNQLASQKTMEELSQKMDRIQQFLDENYKTTIVSEHVHFSDSVKFSGESNIHIQEVSAHTNGSLIQMMSPENDYDSLNAIIREIYHLTKTPLMSIRYAAENLLDLLSDTSKEQLAEFLLSIKNDALLLGTILGEYRRLVTDLPVESISNASNNIETLLKAVVESACHINGKTLTRNFSRFPKEISNHGNNFAVILLKPLIDNAVEAAPDGSEITIMSYEDEDCVSITVENFCSGPLPEESKLQSDGFTTKPRDKDGTPGGGEGLPGIRRIAKKHRISFQIQVNQQEGKVIATLRFPKK